jgi:hypothetical protein
LDEIGNLDMRVQAKLLGVLQDFAITRVGGTQPIPLDIRLVSASNEDLQTLISAGRFRKDLFFRINAVTIALPSLMDRMFDIPDLCKQFIGQFNASLGKNIKGISPQSYKKLYEHSWPGNIRELKNVIHKAAIFCDGEWILPKHLQIEGEHSSSASVKPYRPPQNIDKATFIRVAQAHKGEIKAIAQELRISRPTCYEKLKLWGIDIGAFRAGVSAEPPNQQTESQPWSRPVSAPESYTLKDKVIQLLAGKAYGKMDLSIRLGQKGISGQLNKVIRGMVAEGIIERTIPEKPQSRLQKYRVKSSRRST